MKNQLLTLVLFASPAWGAVPPIPSEAPPLPPREDTLAACEKLETAERSECELRVRQGFDDQESGTPETPVPVQKTPPTDRVPPTETPPADDTDED